MAFRVTQNLLYNNVLSNLNRNLQDLIETQTQLSSGKRISKPSDDPVGVSSAIRLRSRLSETEQLLSNIDSGNTQLNLTDAALDDMSSIIIRAQELAIAQANTTADDNSRTAVAEELNALINQMVDILNTRVGNRYIFAGHDSLKEPFAQYSNGVQYGGDSGSLDIEIESGTTLGISVPGSILLPTAIEDLGGESNLYAYSEKSIPLLNRSLNDMNNGTGVDGGVILVTTASGQEARVDLNGATRLQEILVKINSALDVNGKPLQVTAELDSDNQRIVLTDNSSENDKIPGQVFTVRDLTNSKTALQLGIRGSDTDGDGVINGRDLIPLELSTSLDDMNNGSGIERGQFQMKDFAGNTAVIDITDSKTITDVRDRINNAGTNIRAFINTGGSGLILEDISPGEANGRTLEINEIGTNSHTAEDLGILTPPGGTSAKRIIGEGLDPQITRNTSIELLNRNQGLNLKKISVTNGPVSGEIDLSRASTVGQMIDTINNSGLNLIARINQLGTGIEVTSSVGGRTLTIDDVSGSFTATALGIKGKRDVLVEPLDPVGTESNILPALDGQTRLADLNGGDGVTLGIIRITDSIGNSVNVNISGVNTIQGVLNKINSVGTDGSGFVNVTASITDDLKSLKIVDNSIQNTDLNKILDTGNQSASTSDLASGQTVAISYFTTGNGEKIARVVDVVSQTMPSETAISGLVEAVDEDAGTFDIRTAEGEIVRVKSLQSVQNIYVGQNVMVNGNTNLVGEFEARTVDKLTASEPGDITVIADVDNYDAISGMLTITRGDGTSEELKIVNDRGQIVVEDVNDGTTAKSLGIAGKSVAGSDRIEGSELDPVLSESTSLSLLQGGTFEPGKIMIANGNSEAVIDLSLARTVGEMLNLINSSNIGVNATINSSARGIAISSKIPGSTLVVQKIALKNPDGTAQTHTDGSTIYDNTADQLGLSGSADVIGNLIFLRNALENNSQEDISKTLNYFTDSLNRILQQRTTVGARVNQMDTTESRSQDSKLRNEEILTGVEDIDVIQAVTDLAARENAYNAALSSASRIILPSLLDYL